MTCVLASSTTSMLSSVYRASLFYTRAVLGIGHRMVSKRDVSVSFATFYDFVVKSQTL